MKTKPNKGEFLTRDEKDMVIISGITCFWFGVFATVFIAAALCL